jgi:hypothetical protein
MKLEDVTSVIGGKRLLPRTIIAGDLAALGSAVVSVRPTLDALDDFEPTKPRKLP